MNKTISFLILSILLVGFYATLCWAYEFKDMTNQEMYDFRPSLQYATDDEKKAYWDEWGIRVKMMTAQEKEQYIDASDPTQDKKIKFLYSPGMGYEGPVSVGEDIYGSATRPVYKPLEERPIYGIEKEDKQKEQEDSGETEGESTEKE